MQCDPPQQHTEGQLRVGLPPCPQALLALLRLLQLLRLQLRRLMH